MITFLKCGLALPHSKFFEEVLEFYHIGLSGDDYHVLFMHLDTVLCLTLKIKNYGFEMLLSCVMLKHEKSVYAHKRSRKENTETTMLGNLRKHRATNLKMVLEGAFSV